jgi:hypothetical protein
MSDLSFRILLEMCKNCEETFHKYGKLCASRLCNNYCFDGMDTRDARKEIKKNFDDFQTKIARGQV